MRDLHPLALEIFQRLEELVYAPLRNMDMMWVTIPLVISLVFMTLYFARYRKEELGWNTAFGNTMVFIFVAVAIMREIYMRSGSWGAILESGFYTLLILALIVAGSVLMFFTYFHLLPKRLAFFLFSTPPVNVSVYVIMAMVYADVPPDEITAGAGVVLLFLILTAIWIVKHLLMWFGFSKREETK